MDNHRSFPYQSLLLIFTSTSLLSTPCFSSFFFFFLPFHFVLPLSLKPITHYPRTPPSTKQHINTISYRQANQFIFFFSSLLLFLTKHRYIYIFILAVFNLCVCVFLCMHVLSCIFLPLDNQQQKQLLQVTIFFFFFYLALILFLFSSSCCCLNFFYFILDFFLFFNNFILFLYFFCCFFVLPENDTAREWERTVSKSCNKNRLMKK